MTRRVALLDANVLYPARIRDLLIRLDIAGLYQARWSEQILDECFRSIVENRPDLSPERLAAAAGENRERRRQRTHPAKKRPELMATAPNQVWSWDITKLRGPERGVYYDLFVIIDIYSRYLVAWTIAAAETGKLAKEFIDTAIASQGIERHQLTLHADRGTSMTSKPVAQLLVDLGVARSHSRPHISNDNPYSEAGFKTLKHCPAFPGSFGSIQHARAICETFFAYYNHEHRHSGIGLHTPASVHFGTATQVRAERARTLDAPTPPTPTGSEAADQPHPNCPPSPGSTTRPEKPSYRTSNPLVSQTP